MLRWDSTRHGAPAPEELLTSQRSAIAVTDARLGFLRDLTLFPGRPLRVPRTASGKSKFLFGVSVSLLGAAENPSCANCWVFLVFRPMQCRQTSRAGPRVAVKLLYRHRHRRLHYRRRSWYKNCPRRLVGLCRRPRRRPHPRAAPPIGKAVIRSTSHAFVPNVNAIRTRGEPRKNASSRLSPSTVPTAAQSSRSAPSPSLAVSSMEKATTFPVPEKKRLPLVRSLPPSVPPKSTRKAAG